jgi:hypothetical protein
VRELRRQIASLYFERTALSRNKLKLAEATQATAEGSTPMLAMCDPYIFEFLAAWYLGSPALSMRTVPLPAKTTENPVKMGNSV